MIGILRGNIMSHPECLIMRYKYCPGFELFTKFIISERQLKFLKLLLLSGDRSCCPSFHNMIKKSKHITKR